MRIYKISQHNDPLELFCKKNGYEVDDLNWLGKGDFGDAYLTSDNKVIKATTDKREYNIAKDLLNKASGPFARIYLVDKIGDTYFILQEHVRTGAFIEDLYNMANTYAEDIGEDLEFLESDEIEDEKLRKFVNELQWIYDFQRRIGITGADIRPENLGYNTNGALVCFDISERSDLGYY